MFRPASRAVLRTAQSSLSPARTAVGRRFITTEPPHLRSRSWKSSALRWGIAIAGIYYYNTSPVFAEYPQNNLLNPKTDALEDESETSVLDTLTASSRRKSQKDASVLQSTVEKTSVQNASTDSVEPMAQLESAADFPMGGSPGDLEEEAESEGAFNPVTGEINWDCPCLGGMAHGPCGGEFREAFSCFVYSTEEPKGMDCIEKFQGMQNCFREHPEVYKGELEDDDELDEGLAQEKEALQKEIAERQAAVKEQQSQRRLLEEPGAAPTPSKESTPAPKTSSNDRSAAPAHSQPPTQPEATRTSNNYEKELEHDHTSQIIGKPTPPPVAGEAMPESESPIPKAAHDASD